MSALAIVLSMASVFTLRTRFKPIRNGSIIVMQIAGVKRIAPDDSSFMIWARTALWFDQFKI
jgi:hypothetical protein